MTSLAERLSRLVCHLLRIVLAYSGKDRPFLSGDRAMIKDTATGLKDFSQPAHLLFGHMTDDEVPRRAEETPRAIAGRHGSTARPGR